MEISPEFRPISGNPQSDLLLALESRIQGVEFGIQGVESEIHGVESGIQRPLGLLEMGRLCF